MYAIQDITSGNKKFTYAKKGDSVKVIDSKKHLILLCERGNEKFMCHTDMLQTDPLELGEVKSPEQKAEKELRTELRKLINKDACQFQIIFNRVYYGKVSKLPKFVVKSEWLRIATEIWESSHMALITLIDINKANV